MTTAPDDGKQTPRLHIVEGWQSLVPAPTPGPTTTPRTLNRTQKALVGIVASGVVLIAGIGFAGSYRAVAHLAARKDFGQFAQVFPIGIDAGIVVFLALDLLLTWLRMPYPLLRPAAWALTGATIAFNAALAWPDALGVGMHAATPALFVVAVEAARHATGRVADLTADKHTENPPLMRWLLAPFATFRIWRRMRLWSIRSYEAVITIEQDAAIYREHLKARYGRRWRSKAPVPALMPLRLIRMGTPVGDTVARQEDELAEEARRQQAARAAKSTPTRVICTGRTGTLFLRRPTPLSVAAPSKPAGRIGSPVRDVAALLEGHHAPVVYFISNGDRIKIGTTTHLRNRVRRLCLRTDDIVLVLHGDQALEYKLHDKFAEQRAGDTEWFALADSLADFLATATAEAVANDSANKPSIGDEVGDTTGGQAGASVTANTAASKPPRQRQRQRRTVAKNSANGKPRRSMDEWIDLTRDLYHAEFNRLRKQPTGEEFATAIGASGYGAVSPSTAKNIRTAILDDAAKTITAN